MAMTLHKAEAALEPEQDHPSGERFPLVWSVIIIGITCGTIWTVIWGVGMW